MRSALFVLALVACSSNPPPADASPPVDAAAMVCTPGAQVACACVGGGQGAQRCTVDGRSLGACECPDAAVVLDAPLVDVQPEATAPDVSVPEDRPASVDVAPDAPRCPLGFTADCFGSSVNLGTGVRQPDGTTLHCGRCGNTCAAGSFCEVCQCVR